ncbi:hypothetical protein LXA43DRAFT_940085 [Ganoderma leucocontextum]|nr:hypothetical protein LXA43DRAFT_940085 [Ganoderma leucocontextum]
MANHWLHDVLAPQERVVFQTHHGSRALPHTPDDRLSLRTQFAEAMDDSVVIAPSLDSCRVAGLHVERFQAAYGWETSWPKSLLAALCAANLPSSLPMPSVDPLDPDSNVLVHHSVSVTTTHCEFLRVQINDPVVQFEKIRALIMDFSFPSLHTRLPFTAIRRIISQCLISRIRPYLSYQPISRAHAAELDRLLALRVHEYFRFPFCFNSSLLFLPLSHLGFGFPSITRLNDAAAVSGLLRDLNHHVPTFRTMACITLADWSCMLNHCTFPLEGSITRSFARSLRVLPAAWVVALDVLRAFNISIRSSDQSYLFSGDVALRHLVHLFPSLSQTPSSLAVTNLEHAHFTHLSQLVSWTFSSSSPFPTLLPHQHLAASLYPYSARHDWPAVQAWLPTCGMTGDRWALALPPPLRQSLAESAILTAAALSSYPRLPQPDILATDASAVDHPYPHVTFAAVTSHSSVVLAVSSSDCSASSLHGEVYALIVAALLHLHRPVSAPPARPVLYTDHLNSVRFVQSHPSLPSFSSPPQNPALPLYPNRLVDHLASSSHSPAHPLFSVPLPTFTLPSFVLHSPLHGYVLPPSIPTVLSDLSTHSLTSDPTSRPNSFLFRSLYDCHPPPPHPYTRASSAYSALVQLYARSSQLDDGFTRYRRFGDVAPSCHFGCDTLETAHHLFVHCPRFAGLRDDARSSVTHDTSSLLDATETTLPKDVILRIASALFVDDPDVWPQYHTHYYCGTMPRPIPAETGTHLASRRLLSRIAALWHSVSIRLAARIWGSYKRLVYPFPSHTIPPLSLPPHLSHLLQSV